MAGTSNLPSMVPGFEFLQGLFKNAGAGLPSMGQWIAPTLDPEELDKRIQELKTVQFWLEQNARLLATTIQALEVQRMTLSTLQSMNLPLAGFGEALKIRMPSSPPDASCGAGTGQQGSRRATGQDGRFQPVAAATRCTARDRRAVGRRRPRAVVGCADTAVHRAGGQGGEGRLGRAGRAHARQQVQAAGTCTCTCTCSQAGRRAQALMRVPHRQCAWSPLP